MRRAVCEVQGASRETPPFSTVHRAQSTRRLVLLEYSRLVPELSDQRGGRLFRAAGDDLRLPRASSAFACKFAFTNLTTYTRGPKFPAAGRIELPASHRGPVASS